MATILVKKKKETDNIWIFDVDLEGSKYIVIVPREYWKKLTGGKAKPEELARKSFEFLLEREPKESILREFELPAIQKYFPEYESKIKHSNIL